MDIFLEVHVVGLFEGEEAVNGCPGQVLIIQVVCLEEVVKKFFYASAARWNFEVLACCASRAARKAHSVHAFEDFFDRSFDIYSGDLECFGSFEGVAFEPRHYCRTCLVLGEFGQSCPYQQVSFVLLKWVGAWPPAWWRVLVVLFEVGWSRCWCWQHCELWEFV